ncbi:hypothetical protein ABZ234_03555 [Nocardiopsis sp. NPDC006198]|uniref:hypothetical protein n=1 Tax=Nocardiopsis sp. NPDC006198 TaxID=3154472 RepID=UPI0033A91D24
MNVLTDTERALLALVDAAEAAGLDAVIEIPADRAPRTVDLRVVRGDEVVAAMRVRIQGGEVRYEIPARPGGDEVQAVRTRYLGPVGRPVAAEDLAVLDHWWAKCPGTGRQPVPVPSRRVEDTPRWMRPPVPAS